MTLFARTWIPARFARAAIARARFPQAWLVRACFPAARRPGRVGVPGAVLLMGERPPLAPVIPG